MSLKPMVIPPVPEETARVARAAFPKGTLVLRLRDELGSVYQDERFAALYPERGQPAAAPWRLALVSVLQFVEGLSDRQAAEAVRSRGGAQPRRCAAEAVRGRIDWKYAWGLELTDPGFDFSVLSEFRSRLLQGGQGRPGADAVGNDADATERGRFGQGPQPATHRLHPCPGRRPHAQPPGDGW